jgi:hypothetical protein
MPGRMEAIHLSEKTALQQFLQVPSQFAMSATPNQQFTNKLPVEVEFLSRQPSLMQMSA